MIVPVVKIKRMRSESPPVPRYQTEHAAGFDLAADLDNILTLRPRERAAVPSGIALEIPPGFEGQVRARSGRAFAEGLALVNAPGTIDAGYRGEIQVILLNTDPAQPVSFRRGDRIAQLVVQRVEQAAFREVATLPGSARGDGGFGSTGGHAGGIPAGAPAGE